MTTSLREQLSPDHLDALREAMNIATGRAANALAQMLNARVHIGVTEVHILGLEDFHQQVMGELGGGATAIVQTFHDHLEGHASLLLPREHAARLIRALLNRPYDAIVSFSAEEESVLAEVGNIILNASLSTLADIAQARYRVEPPQVYLNLSAAQLNQLVVTSLPPGAEAILLLGRLQINDILLQFYTALLLALQTEGVLRLLRKLAEWLT